LALAWGKRAPDEAQLATLCARAEVVSVRAALPRLPEACSGRLVLDGVDYSRGGAVELWREPTAASGWRAVWVADARGARPWSRYGDPAVSDSGG